MANFAKAQLMKYGWTEGKGLGKNESGISEALKPKLKFDNAGIGHDRAEQFTYHWWETAFNQAAKNVAVDSDAHGVSMKVIDEDTVDIVTSKTSLKALKKNHAIQYGNFLKTSTLLQDGKLISENHEELKDSVKIEKEADHVKLTDEELFAACGGRTAHKGARHGLTLNGKLARIAEQERQLMEKMKGSTTTGSSATNETAKVEDNKWDCTFGTMGDDNEDFEMVKPRKRSKKKRKNIKSVSRMVSDDEKLEALSEGAMSEVAEPQPSCSYSVEKDHEKIKSKSKKKKKNRDRIDDAVEMTANTTDRLNVDDNANTIEPVDKEEEDEPVILAPIREALPKEKSKKASKKERRRIHDLSQRLNNACVIDERVDKAKKRKREEAKQLADDAPSAAPNAWCQPVSKKSKLSDVAIYKCEADRLNERIEKSKQQKRRRKDKDTLDTITDNLMAVNLQENLGNEIEETNENANERDCRKKRKKEKTKKNERKKLRMCKTSAEICE